MNLAEKIQTRSAKIAVIGLGYVGLPLAVACAEAGFSVVGIDMDEKKVNSINRGESLVQDVSDTRLRAVVSEKRLRAFGDYSQMPEVDVAVICVPTPLNKSGDPDVSYILAVAEMLRDTIRPDTLVVLESTTFPGTTQDLLAPILAESGLTIGENLFVAFSPERIDPGNKRYHLQNVPKVVGGITPQCQSLAVAFYQTIIDRIVPVSSPMAAEMTKLLENTFRSVNIALVNEMAIMCDKLGLNVWEIVDAAATKPYGFMKFVPGPGVGGHCIPVDPHYLSWKLKQVNYNARFIQLAGEINAEMPIYVVDKVVDALNADRKAVNGARILMLGVAYKPDIDDVRESPALDVLRLLEQRGAELYYNDPHVPSLKMNGTVLESQPLSPEMIASMDCVVVITAHSAYDWTSIKAAAKVIVDTRNAVNVENGDTVRVLRL